MRRLLDHPAGKGRLMKMDRKCTAALLAVAVFLLFVSGAAADVLPAFSSFTEGRCVLLEKTENRETATDTYQTVRDDAAAWQAELESAGYGRQGLWLLPVDDGDILLVAAYSSKAADAPALFGMNVMGEPVQCHLLVQTVFRPSGEIHLVVTYSRGIAFFERSDPMPAPKKVQQTELVTTHRTCSNMPFHNTYLNGGKDCPICKGSGWEEHIETRTVWVDAEGHWERETGAEVRDCWACHGTGRYGLYPCPLCLETGKYTLHTSIWVWKWDKTFF